MKTKKLTAKEAELAEKLTNAMALQDTAAWCPTELRCDTFKCGTVKCNLKKQAER